jgi:hypothetical protein
VTATTAAKEKRYEGDYLMFEVQAAQFVAKIVKPQTLLAALPDEEKGTLRIWGVFALCLLFSTVGVGLVSWYLVPPSELALVYGA